MIGSFNSETTLVALPKTLIQTLIDLQAALDQDAIDALQASLAKPSNEFSEGKNAPDDIAVHMPPVRKYSAEFLGKRLTTRRLPEMFAEFVDLTAEVAPEALDSLSALRARRRGFISRTSEDIHPNRPDMPVMCTKSGWWISKNIGQADLKRGLRALAQAAGLEYGKDLKFPAGNK